MSECRAVLYLKLTANNPDPTRLGATRAQADFEVWREQLIQGSGTAACITLVDFDGVQHTNTSYIRNSLFWLNACGRANAAEESVAPTGDLWQVRPLPIIPMASNLVPEVREAIDEVFFVRRAACLEVVSTEAGLVQQARLLGALESKLLLSLQQLCRFGREATAAELHAKFSARDDIGVTAWNNRLVELFAALLVTRRRQGKFWHYQPLAKEIEDGRGPRT